jgi:hypothetical protein
MPQGWTGLEVAGGIAQQAEEPISGNMRLRKRQQHLAEFHAQVNNITVRRKPEKFTKNNI